MVEGISLIGERYRIIEPIGEGGMASVFKAYDTRLERNVAVKVIRKENFTPAALDQVLKRFEREAKSLAQLSHPNIVKVIDFGEFNGAPYLILEYLSGGTLREHLDKPIPYAVASQFIIPVTRALSYAHQRNIIHRDIKPSNILLTDSSEPMLSDFGIAKILTGDEIGTLTGSGIIVGTPEYIAPEQGLGNPVDARTDIYALGVVFYEMITGRKPFQADTPMGVVIKHIAEIPPPPHQLVSGISKEAEETILKALAKDPCERYQDMASFTLALSGLPSWSTPSQEAFFISSARAKTSVQDLKTPQRGEGVSKPPSQPSLEDTPRLIARVARLEKAISDALAAGDIEDAEGLLANLENLGERGQQAAERYRSQVKQSQIDQEKKQQAEVASAIQEVETRLSQGKIQQAEDGLLKLESYAAAPHSEVERMRRALDELKRIEANRYRQSETRPDLEVVKEMADGHGTDEISKISPPSRPMLTRSSLPVVEALPQPGLQKRKMTVWIISLILILGLLIGAVLVLPKIFRQVAGETKETAPSTSIAMNIGGTVVMSATPEAVQTLSTQGSSLLPLAATKTPWSQMPLTSTSTATKAATATPSPMPTYQVRVKVDSANVRSGPGTVYGVIAKLKINDALVAAGRNAAGDWLVLTLSDGRPGWVSISILEFTFDPKLLPITAAPPTPVIVSSPTSSSPTSKPGSENPPAPTRTSPPAEPPTWTPPPAEPPTWTPPPP